MWDSKTHMVFSEEQFKRTRRLALNLAGLQLSERHRELLGRRTRRLGIQSDAGLEALLHQAEAGGTAACQQLLRLLTTKVTSFFRYPEHFELAAEHVLRKVQQNGQAHLWSAAAATGEEAYSLAMQLVEAFQSDEPPITILATDIDAEAISIARRGQYPPAAVRALDPTTRERFLSKNPPAEDWAVKPALRQLVDFRVLNLADITWSVESRFDVIFCRNVLMYMEPDHRYSTLERMTSLLQPDGLLFLDPAEGLGKAAHLFTDGVHGVFSIKNARSRSLALKGKI